MSFRVFVCVLALAVAAPASAVAIEVVPMAGDVRIGTWRGFQNVVGPTEVSAGAQVMVGPEGAAAIAYSDTCIVSAPPAAVTVVESRPPCSDFAEPSYFGFSQSNQEGLRIDGAPLDFTPRVDVPEPNGGAIAAEDRTREWPTVAPPPPRSRSTAAAEEKRSWDHSLLIAGGVIVGAGILAAILASSGSR